MPAVGPDLNYAREKGRKVALRLLDQLINEHELLDVTDTRYENFGFWPNSRKRWTEAKSAFVKVVEDLFAEDACNRF